MLGGIQLGGVHQMFFNQYAALHACMLPACGEQCRLCAVAAFRPGCHRSMILAGACRDSIFMQKQSYAACSCLLVPSTTASNVAGPAYGGGQCWCMLKAELTCTRQRLCLV